MWNLKNTSARRAVSVASLATIALLTITAVAGCSRIGQLQAARSSKAANAAYAAQDYPHAAELYEEAIKQNPDLGFAYFYLGNSYEQQYRPSQKGEPDERRAADQGGRQLQDRRREAGERADRTGEESRGPRAEVPGVVLRHRQAERSGATGTDPDQHDQARSGGSAGLLHARERLRAGGRIPHAERVFLLARDVKPTDPEVYLQLAGYYNRQGQFDKTIEALERRAEREPKNPEAFQMIGGYYYDEVQGDARLTAEEKRTFIDKGLQAVDKALELNKEYVDALIFKGLLLRQQALVEKDQAKVKALLQEATELSERANALRKQKAAGIAP